MYQKNIQTVFMALMISAAGLLLVFSPVAAFAAHYYVNNATGNNGVGVDDLLTNDGSRAFPWETIHFAVPQLTDGDTLHIAAGEYSIANGEDAFQIVIDHNNVTLKGDPAGTVLDGSTTFTPSWMTGVIVTGTTTRTSGVNIEDLEIVNFPQHGIDLNNTEKTNIMNCDISLNAANGINVAYSSDTLICANFLEQNANFGINVINDSNHTWIRQCDIRSNTMGVNIVLSTGTVVSDCVIGGHPNAGIIVSDCGLLSDGTILERNTLLDNNQGVALMSPMPSSLETSPIIRNNLIFEKTPNAMQTGIYMLNASSFGGMIKPQVSHNTIDGGMDSGIYMDIMMSGTVGPDIYYNIISNFISGSGVVDNTEGSATPILGYNLFFNNNLHYGFVTPGLGDLVDQDPAFANPAVDDYHLMGISPAVNTAIGSPAEDDHDRRVRPFDGYRDMGCFEFYDMIADNDPPRTPVLNNPPLGPFFYDESDPEATVGVTLEAGGFFDPDGDTHLATHWMITPVSFCGFRCIPETWCFHSKTALTEHVVPADHFLNGIGYKWQAGFMDTGSGLYTYPEEGGGSFVMGTPQEVTLGADIPAGAEIPDYQMRTAPVLAGEFGAAAVLEQAIGGAYKPDEVRIGIYDPLKDGGVYWEYPDFDLMPGRAFWILSRAGIVDFKAEGVPVNPYENYCVPLAYYDAPEMVVGMAISMAIEGGSEDNGWNMIGPPNAADYRWSDVLVIWNDEFGNHDVIGTIGQLYADDPDNLNEYIDLRFWLWEDGEYFEYFPEDADRSIPDSMARLRAYHGYWVQARQPGISLVFTAASQLEPVATDDDGDGLVASVVKNIRYIARGILSPVEAIATEGDDSPPPPMSLTVSDKREESSFVAGCFISSVME